VVRHASRYGLPLAVDNSDSAATLRRDAAWLLSRGTDPVENAALGLRRARAATLFLLGLPGSTYLYQGEELGLREVADLPDAARQDPTFFRSPGVDVGRDGCRVPLPWTSARPSFGFGTGPAHLPQPPWFTDYAVAHEAGDETSTLTLYRTALALRRDRLAGVAAAEPAEPDFEWQPADPGALAYRRRGGWSIVTNFSTAPVHLPPGRIILASTELSGAMLPGVSTVWLVDAD
jgi:alpha-glucosidase